MSPRHECVIAGCRNSPAPLGHRVICRRHWRQLPADLRERVKWAVESEDEMDLYAALQAVMDELA